MRAICICILAVATGFETTSALAATAAAYDILEEVVVTAQKRLENLQDVPIAISTVSGAQLAAMGATSITDIASVTPGLQMSTAQGLLSPRIRGVGSNLANVENSVAIYLDGVYLANSSGSLLSLNNVAQIETLKGPQGTLFGRNATGGALLIQTPDPTTDPSASLAVSYGNYDTATTNAYVARGLGANVAADLAFHYGRQGTGYGTNLFDGAEVGKTNLDFASRSKWVFTPTAGDTIHLILDIESRKGSNAADDNVPAGTYPSFLVNPTLALPARPYDMNSAVDPKDRLNAGGVSARIDHDMGWAKLVSISAFRLQQFKEQFEITLTPDCCILYLPGVPVAFDPTLPVVHIDARDRQVSQEVQLVSPDKGEPSRLSWVTGLYYFHDTEEEFDAASRVTTQSYSGFGETHIEFLPATRMTLGLRYTDEEKALAVESGPGGPVASLTAEPSEWFSKVTYRLGVDHRFTGGTLIYASKNLGFKSGGYNATQPSLPAFKPETLSSYEAGIKSEFLDHRMRLNTAVFYYNYDNIQMNKLTPTNQLAFYNGPPAVSYGADLDLTARVSKELTLNVGASYVHDRFTADFPLAPRNVPNPGPIPGGSVSTLASVRGNRLPNTPDWTTNAGFTYVRETSIGEWTVSADFFHSSGWFGEPDNVLHQAAYNTVDASVNVRLPSQHYRIGFWGRNLSNARVYTAISGNALTDFAEYAPPRTYGIKLSAEL
jgi:iron complex outermembrane receptor protein